MLEYVSNKIAVQLRKANPDHPVSLEVQAFAIALLLNQILTLLLAIIAGILLDRLIEVLIVLFAFAFLRIISGGYHMKSGVGCILISAGGAVLLSYVHMPLMWTYLTITASLILILIFAPNRQADRTIIPEKYNLHFKGLAFIMVAANFFLQSPIIAATHFVQCISLIHITKRR